MVNASVLIHIIEVESIQIWNIYPWNCKDERKIREMQCPEIQEEKGF